MNASERVQRALDRAARVFNIGTARLDYVLDEAQQASREAEQRARAAGLDEQSVAFESLDAYHERRHELLSRTRGITDAQLVARADERDGTDLGELAKIEAHLDQLAAEGEQAELAEDLPGGRNADYPLSEPPAEVHATTDRNGCVWSREGQLWREQEGRFGAMEWGADGGPGWYGPHREQTKVVGFALSEADEQRIRELQGREQLTELEDMELDDLLVTRCELAAARDAHAELDDEPEPEIELDR